LRGCLVECGELKKILAERVNLLGGGQSPKKGNGGGGGGGLTRGEWLTERDIGAKGGDEWGGKGLKKSQTTKT